MKEFRRRSQRAQTALIVIIDADVGTVKHRLLQLDQALEGSEQKAVDDTSEEIARLVPKRNVETWILCLNGEAVNEEDDYTEQDRTSLIPEAAEALFHWTQSDAPPPTNCIESLRSGIRELKRLDL